MSTRQKFMLPIVTPHKKVSFLILIFLFFFSQNCFAKEQIKTVEFFVGNWENVISGQTIDKDFTIYIGDNISGIENALKSVFFTISGVYNGGGTLTLKIDYDNSTTKQFSLPNVSSPTNFEILYKDDTQKINPSTSGSYQYTLNIDVPSGIIVYSLGAKLTITYKYDSSSCPEGQSNNEKVKTIQGFVSGLTDPLTNSFDQSFSIYIGDNIGEVSSPIKSIYFTISGFYTGGAGSLTLKIDSDPSTQKSFSFPSVSDPTFFEIIYKDPINKINPTTPGNYNYTLNITPSNITIFGLGSKITITFRYKPPICGGVTTGELVSAVFDTTQSSDGPAYNSIMWKGSLGTGKVRLKIATSDNPNGPWEFRGPEPNCSVLSVNDNDWYVILPNSPAEIGCFGYHNNKRYFKYKIQLCMATDCQSQGSTSPIVEEVIINWSP